MSEPPVMKTSCSNIKAAAFLAPLPTATPFNFLLMSKEIRHCVIISESCNTHKTLKAPDDVLVHFGHPLNGWLCDQETVFERANTSVKGAFVGAIMVGMNCHIGSIIICDLNSCFDFFLRRCVNLQRIIEAGDSAARSNGPAEVAWLLLSNCRLNPYP